MGVPQRDALRHRHSAPRAQHHGPDDDASSNLALDDAPVDEIANDEQQRACVRGLVDALPESYRTVIALSKYAELTNPEIAQALGISLDAVKIRLHRARARLRREIEAECTVESCPGGSVDCSPKR